MVFACWNQPRENKWVTVPMLAIKPLLPEAPEQDPHAPGPFALADPVRLRGILDDAGFKQIELTTHEVPICLAQSGGAKKAVEFSTKIGPAARAMADVDEAVRPRITEALLEALLPYDDGDRVVLPGSIWIVQAKNAN